MIESGELLLDHDREFLVRKGWRCTISRQPDAIDVIVHNYELPDKYAPMVVDMLVKILPGYPQVGMDMFWTRPEVRLAATQNYAPATDAFQEFQGMRWQRWSRHGTWRADIDNLETFFASIWRELTK